METVTIAHSAVTAKLHNPSREVKLEVQRILSYEVSGAEQTVAFKRSAWDGRSSFLEFRTGKFPAGFVHLVTAHLMRSGYKVNIVKKPLPEPLGPENPVVDAFPEDPRYDYQREVVRRLLKHGKIIAQVATGGGKSRIARLAFARINRPTLFLTTRSLLMYQMKDAFERDLKVPVSVLGDGQFGRTVTDADGNERTAIKKMSVGMVQTLVARLEEKTLEGEFEAVFDSITKAENSALATFKKSLEKAKLSESESKKRIDSFIKEQLARRASPEKIKKVAQQRLDKHERIRQQTIKLLGMFEFVILEEAHEASGNSYYDILKHCTNAHYRLALTATPFMKDDEEANMRLMACSGPVGIKITEEMLIDRGILAKPFFKYRSILKAPPKLYRSTGWQAAYRLGIVEHEARNQMAIEEALEATAYGLSVMALVQHKKHGEELRQKMEAAGLRVEFIDGDSEHDERKRALAKLASGEIDVLIGSTILDVGVDAPAVGMIILLGGGKAEVALRQRIGRGLRAKKVGPNVAFIVDFADGHNDHLTKHYKQRRNIVETTSGFGENILRPGERFDYEGLGFTRRR